VGEMSCYCWHRNRLALMDRVLGDYRECQEVNLKHVGQPSVVQLHINQLLSNQSLRPYMLLQGDHLSGKPGNVSCQGSVMDCTKSQGNVGWKNLVREKLPKIVYCKLHICVYTGI